MLKKGQIIKLNNNKEYIVVNKINAHNIKYIFLMTTVKPLEIVIATEKRSNGETILKEIKDNEELNYALTKLVSLQKEKDNKKNKDD